jgi:hopanoid biosynthesis associated protein HpnK
MLQRPLTESLASGAPADSCAERLDLIVHADDFGISSAVNAGILEAHREGILTSTSIIASGEAFDEAIAIAKANDSLDVGIHLTLAEEKPILPADAIPSLIGADGHFHRHATVFAGRYLRSKISLDDVRRELDAQIRKVLAANVRISHLDGHQHLHMLPGILRITMELAHSYNIPRVRLPREKIKPYMLRKAAALPRVAQLAVLNRIASSGKRLFSVTTDHFAGFYHGGALSTQNLLQVVASLPSKGTCELMCHPGVGGAEASHGHWQYSWADELAALKSSDVAAALKARGVRLISWKDLPGGAPK